MFRIIGAYTIARLLPLVLLGIPSAWAQDFRVETDIYVGTAPEPQLKYVTVFAGSTTYDFRLTEPKEWVIYDAAAKRINILSPEYAVRTEISQNELVDFMAGLKANVTESEPLFHFACNPTFDNEIDSANRILLLKSGLLSYRFHGESPKPNFQNAVSRYQDFADWSARLSGMRAGNLNLPPFARIEANRVLAQQGWIPLEVTRTTVSRSKKVELRSKHSFHWLVPESDRRMINKASDELIQFKLLPYKKFIHDTTLASKSVTPK